MCFQHRVGINYQMSSYKSTCLYWLLLTILIQCQNIAAFREKILYIFVVKHASMYFNHMLDQLPTSNYLCNEIITILLHFLSLNGLYVNLTYLIASDSQQGEQRTQTRLLLRNIKRRNVIIKRLFHIVIKNVTHSPFSPILVQKEKEREPQMSVCSVCVQYQLIYCNKVKKP